MKIILDISDAILEEFAAVYNKEETDVLADFCTAQLLQFIQQTVVSKRANEAVDVARKQVVDGGVAELDMQITALKPVEVSKPIL